METPGYPVQLSVDYPDRQLNRLTTFFRVFTVIPIAIVLGALSGGNDFTWSSGSDGAGSAGSAGATGAGVLFFATLLMIVFRQKYPRWWYDWNLNLLRDRKSVV